MGIRRRQPFRPLHPKLIQLCLQGIHHDLKGDEKAEYEGYHQQRCAALAEMTQCELVLCPIFSNKSCQHWTLLTIRGDEVRYFETLADDHFENKCAAVQLLSLTRPNLQMPNARSNKTLQTGSTCGFWVLRYIEEEIREFKEGQRGTAEWPDIFHWRKLLMSLTTYLINEAKKVLEDDVADKVKQESVIAKAKAKAAQLKKIIENSKVCQQAKDDAKAELDKIPQLKRCFENLRPEYALAVEVVRQNPKYVCGSCRWSGGCLRCDPDKALAAYLKKEFGPEDGDEDIFA